MAQIPIQRSFLSTRHGASDTPDHELGVNIAVNDPQRIEKVVLSGDVEELDRLLPHSQVVVLPDCGPWLFYENPQLCADAVREFLVA